MSRNVLATRSCLRIFYEGDRVGTAISGEVLELVYIRKKRREEF